MKLSILIPSLIKRQDQFLWLKENLFRQIVSGGFMEEVEILSEIDNGEQSIGTKRNTLLSRAEGEYVCFFDDDDTPSMNYVSLIMKAIESQPDCCSLTGNYNVDGKFDGIFEHSIKYKAYKTNIGAYIKYERYPNHLNCIKSSIAKQFNFPEINHGEDTDFAKQIHESGLLKTEVLIPETIYHYNFKSNK